MSYYPDKRNRACVYDFVSTHQGMSVLDLRYAIADTGAMSQATVRKTVEALVEEGVLTKRNGRSATNHPCHLVFLSEESS